MSAPAIVNRNNRQPIIPHGGNLNAGHVPTSPAKAVVVINRRQPAFQAVPTTAPKKK